MHSKIENQTRKILVVDDDMASRRIVEKALLYEGYQVELAESGTEALSKINAWSPSLVLLDVNMPGLNGLDTLKSLRSKGEYISTIFVSGNNNTEDVIRGLDAGADDYIGKPFDTLELLARVRSHLRNKDIRDELAQANRKLQELVDIDDLTGLFNMRSLYQKLDYELDRATRYNGSVAVIMMDMDHFKNVNDGHDHLFGSFVLAEVGKIIKSNMRSVDFAARYGGDEFLICLTEIDQSGARAFAERLRKKIENHFFDNGIYQIQLTASVGFSYAEPERIAVDARSLVRYADRALYSSKETGRNQVQQYVLSEHELGDGHRIPPQNLRKKGS
ncbi:MAG: diguanylate cyclase [Bdellovibrionales bacterium]|nr:diguanylate cyclase [Bdellovibrionales bacterium]